MENKHAYLIIAHKDDLTFRTLVRMLDDIRNDIFIHMDSKNTQYDIETTEKLVKYSKVYHSERSNVTWGGYSQINSEYLLLKKATSTGKYAYYHLLSGEDLPIKTQDYIHNFFEKNNGKEFVRFENKLFKHDTRVQLYHYFQEKIGRKNRLLIYLNRVFLFVQKKLKINRYHNIQFQKGTNWFSITDELARYVVSQENWVKDIFRNTLCCDEVFLQTLIVNSDYKNNLYHEKFDNSPNSIMRLIDWERGTPYVFRNEDLTELIESEMLFARKFDAAVDSEIITNIDKLLKEK